MTWNLQADQRLDELVRDWLDDLRGQLDPDTAELYRLHWATHLIPFFGQAQGITPQSIAGYCRARLKEPEHFRMLAIDEAESLFGGKLDRRRRYALLLGDVCERSSYVVPCSGCACDCGDGYPCSHEPGGCHECGHTGRRRYIDWLNVNLARGLRSVACVPTNSDRDEPAHGAQRDAATGSECHPMKHVGSSPVDSPRAE